MAKPCAPANRSTKLCTPSASAASTTEPALAVSNAVNADLTEYTFTLRDGVTFHNGATLDANDVVATFAAQWDAMSPNHVGRTGTFEYFGAFFGCFLNAEVAVATLADNDGLLSLSAPDCEYGGEFKSIEAVDAKTVKFDLCYPDPAFLSKVAFSVFAIQDKDYPKCQQRRLCKDERCPQRYRSLYIVKAWNRGDSVVYEAYPRLLGRQSS